MHKLAMLVVLVSVLVNSGGTGLLAQDDVIVSPLLIEELDELEADVMELRELDALFPVDRLFPSQADAIDTILAMTEEDLTEEILFEETQFYLAFDFIEEGVDLWDVYSVLLADQVAGFYDPETREMNTLLISGEELGDSLPGLERIIYSHEYVHALQDQYFDLNAYMENLEEPDEILAAMSLVEGDASLAMQDYIVVLLQKEPGLALQILSASLTMNLDVPEGTPAILEAELMMPYMEGMEFALALRNSGGWETINAAFAQPPISTEQILHPEKYGEGEMPIRVAIADVSALLAEDWLFIDERSLGEFYLREYLKTQLSGRKASRAAAGWGGDRYQLYYNDVTDQRAWVLRLAWDTPADAAEFVEVYEEFAASRISGEVLTDNGYLSCWQIEIGIEALCFAYDDEGDVVIAYAPDWELAAEMIAAQQ